jgi:hypothetical protein
MEACTIDVRHMWWARRHPRATHSMSVGSAWQAYRRVRCQRTTAVQLATAR